MSSASIGKRERDGKFVGWEVRWRDADGRQRSKRFQRKADAERHRAFLLADLARGEYVDPERGKVTVEDVARQWLATKVGIRVSTRSGYEYIVNADIVPALGRRSVASVRQSDVKAFIAKLEQDGRQPGTIRNIFRVLKQIMQTAVDDDRIKNNPCQGVKLPRSEPHEQHYLSAAEVAALAEAMPQRYRTLAYLAAYTGMRWGEIAALRWKRVDLLGRTITVAESVKRVKGELQYGPPKTAAGRRKIRIPKFLVEMLIAEPTRAADNPEGFVFESPRGGPMSSETVCRRHFKRAAALAVPDKPGLRFHDLRHTCASLLIAKGAHPKAIQRHLGHSTITVTLDRYGHMFPEESDRLADALDDTFRSLTKAPTAETG